MQRPLNLRGDEGLQRAVALARLDAESPVPRAGPTSVNGAVCPLGELKRSPWACGV